MPTLSDPLPYIAERPPPPPPAPVEPALPLTQRPLAARPFVPTAQPVSPGSAPGSADLADPQAAPDGAEAEGDGLTWPCPSCGTAVPMSLDYCNSCGAGFLSGASSGHSLQVPLFGNIGRLSPGQKLGLGAAITFVLIAIFVLIATIGGAVFG